MQSLDNETGFFDIQIALAYLAQLVATGITEKATLSKQKSRSNRDAFRTKIDLQTQRMILHNKQIAAYGVQHVVEPSLRSQRISKYSIACPEEFVSLEDQLQFYLECELINEVDNVLRRMDSANALAFRSKPSYQKLVSAKKSIKTTTHCDPFDTDNALWEYYNANKRGIDYTIKCINANRKDLQGRDRITDAALGRERNLRVAMTRFIIYICILSSCLI